MAGWIAFPFAPSVLAIWLGVSALVVVLLALAFIAVLWGAAVHGTSHAG